ncbi:piggyBac transposable element-derived protein 4-like [Actinia tenebrosa]|uniref:PiggyBac transposable element-derived protein 4-like n=1 Tax=Actinia tenebrosa TaxID=6105 RepID=A0A6P8H1K3_ACTTE|nr:piggyBac transposable element-derived protein 4-like [Actinia tenebrosa]
MRWDRTPPVLTLQWKDNKVVSLLTTIGNANEICQVTRKVKTGNVWRQINVQQSAAIKQYNSYMNAVDRSDQILANNNCLGKCVRWWKTLFFHLIDIAIVNSYILFREHRANNPNVEALRRPKSYSILDYKEELVRQLAGIGDDDPLPTSGKVKPSGQFITEHLPVFSEDVRCNCVVCYHEGRGQLRVASYCDAPQCQVFLHITSARNCFRVWHSKDYHHD